MNFHVFESWIWNFLGIVIESIPFILIASVVSAIIQFYISEELIAKVLPRNKIGAYIIASLSGLLFPVCECAIVPIGNSLIKKGLPIGVGITFMLAVPIINPIVVMSTYYAFDKDLKVVIIRVVGGLVSAIIVGSLIGLFYENKSKSVLKDGEIRALCDCCLNRKKYNQNFKDTFVDLINHGSKEFLNISMYFIFGALLSSIFATFVSNKNLEGISANSYIGIIIMMLLAFLLSLCSEADAFIAKGFLSNFGLAGVSAFLILGPMMDLKNLLVTLSLFEKKFVLKLFTVISVVVFFISFTLVVLRL